ncbi:hypothetical protein CALVIDRAFT_538050 [Calocera viscosa TUFC12733]|uniref:GST N-terminal domain-containing protein n=1 Tax=Calocera viscosa (strain TUFC12733) TaxID=1330018 RepID=A0A167LG21_CALVF|nr:hypothetical protein CALVIDRAFT_538050 [Calocera viscosa TUFC12733]
MPGKITFYDVLSALDPPQWSSNTLRTRLALNFLQLPYTTVFISYPDIESTLCGLGLEPSNPPPYDKQPAYTLPVIKDGDKWVSGSFDIAVYLAKQYPASPMRRALFPHNTIPLARLIAGYLNDKVLTPARKLAFPRVPTWLDDRGAAYFRATRQQWLGVPLEEYYSSPDEQAKIRIDVLKGLDGISKMLKDHPNGPFLQGEDCGYSDLQVIAVMAWIRRGDPDTWNTAMESPEMKQLWEACEAWLA